MLDFFDFCNEMLCVADHRGYFIHLNSAWTKTLGWSREELTSRPYLEFVHPEDVEATRREATLLQSEGYETVRFENRYLCKDGEYKWLAWQARSKPGADEVLATARDVSDEHQRAEKLQESEERFRLLASQAPIGIAQADATGKIFYVNSQLCRIFGIEAENVLDFGLLDLAHPEDRERLTDVWRSHLRSGENTPAEEFRFQRADGSIHWAHVSIALLRNERGETRGQIATIEDVTEQKMSDQRLRSIFAQAPVGIAVIDSHSGRFLEINPTYAAILGRSPEEALATDFQSVTHPEDLQEDLDQMAQLLQGKVSQFRMEKRYLLPSGSVAWVDLTVVPLWEKGETPGRHLAIVEDITERKRADERLRTREAQLEGLLENTSAVIYLKDRDERYLLTNERFRSVFGMTADDIVGKTDFDLFPEEVAAAFQAADAKVWRTQSTEVFEEVAIHQDGPHTYRSVKFPVTDRRGKMIAIGGISTDITDLKRAYEDLAEKERLMRDLIEVQEKEKQFICYEIHDGLIQYVVGSVMQLESLAVDLSGGDSLESLERIIDNLKKGIQDGRRVIRGIRPTVLDDMGIEAAIADLIDQMSDSGISIELEFDSRIGRLPKSLEATIYRVVQEALSNARRHSGTDRVTIRLFQVDGGLQITVRDFGRGFDVESARHNGFGLAGINERVRVLGGDCQIDSVEGSGTTILIHVPAEASVADE